MSESKNNLQNENLNEVERLLFLLSDLNIIDNAKSSDGQTQEPPQKNFDNPKYPFTSLLDELPFLRDVQPDQSKKLDRFEQSQETSSKITPNLIEQISESQITSSVELDTINAIQNFFLDNLTTPISRSSDSSTLSSSVLPSEDDNALHMLQDMLASPELEDLKNFKIAVERKLGVVENQVNNPELRHKIESIESLIADAALNFNTINSKLLEIGAKQAIVPAEIANVRERLSELEHKIYQPDELIQLILPIIVEILRIKSSQSREEMCQVITPIIAEVIFERSQLDNVAMSRAIADILPNAISEQIRNSPDQIAKAIAPEIGVAIREQIRLDRDAIIYALAPEMSAAIKQQIVLERESMVDALYPVIGSTISKYFAEAIRSINEKVEQTFSVEGFQRKLRAKMQGVSEAELILRESTPFEIQAIFLIHNLSGLVIIDIQKSNLDTESEPIDSDMLAGMLTAIRSFANECISRSENTSEIDAINYSGSKILLEVAGYCYLAVIIRGEPNGKLINKIRDLFGRVIQTYGDLFKDFDGDPNIIPVEVETELKKLIQAELPQKSQKSFKPILFTVIALSSLIFVPIGFYQYRLHQERQLESKVLEAFASNPELSIYQLKAITNGDDLQLSGKLPDHLRNLAVQVATESVKTDRAIHKIENKIYSVNVLPAPTLVAAEVRRLTKALNYTQGVQISSQFQNGKVIITGQVEQPSMISAINQTFTNVAGVSLVSNAVTIKPPLFLTRIYFASGETTIPASDLSKLVEIQAFLSNYPDYDLKILAYNDGLGDPRINYQLGVKRIQTVRTMLIQKGIVAKRLHLSEIIDPAVPQTLRWVEFQPILKTISISNSN
ncbi:BON domain-containing protein [Pseudanabaena biceps]|nr:BON domain-containing protein [Pseudanabaena biceps]